MAHHFSPGSLPEGQSTHKPPLLDKVPFDYWKNRMSIFLRSQNPKLWRMLSFDYKVPTKTIDGIVMEKPFDDWTASELELDELNAKTMNCLYCALMPDDYMRVSTLSSAKEIWNKLIITYEGTNEVRDANISRLVHEYELFRMKSDESISDMHTRFMKTVNSLHSLGRVYKNQDLALKILRCLPKEWDPKVAAIMESKDLSTYTLDQLLGSLLAHEQAVAAREQEETPKKKEKAKAIALQAERSESSSTSGSEDEKSDLAMISKHLGSLMRKKNHRYGKSKVHKFRTNKFSAEGNIQCYNCKKFGHMKWECPDLNEDKEKRKEKVREVKDKRHHKKNKRKALWAHSDSETSSSSSSSEEVNLCLMAHGEEEILNEDPKFSEFLKRRRAELEKSKNEEMYSDEEVDTDYANGAMVNEDMHVDERKTLNSYTVDMWCWLVVEQPKGPALPNLLNAFHAACRYGLSSDESQLYEIPDKAVFSKVLIFILCECDGIFRKWLGVSDSCSKDSVLKLENTSEWIKVRPLMKSYLKNCLLLLNQVTDGQILVFILTRLKYSVVFFAAFPSIMELLIKISVHLWITGEKNLSLSSFLLVREIASKLDSDWYGTCLMKTYKAFVGQSKFFGPGNVKRFEFLENSIVELYSLDLQKSYHQVFASLQLLAKILSEATKTMKKEELRKIHNWQYIKCISLWVKFINCNLKEHDLQPLLYLSILVIKGIVYLFPGLRYLPLRFRCVQMLNQLSLSSGVFIPVASLVFDCLELKGSNADTTHVKAFNFSSLLKVSKHFLKSHNFQEECILSAVELFSAHFSQWSYHISFPELATIPLMLFKRFHEGLTDETHRRQVKRFIDQVEQNREFIERKRDEVSFSPHDDASIDSFLQTEKIGSNSFIQYYASVLQKSQTRNSST